MGTNSDVFERESDKFMEERAIAGYALPPHVEASNASESQLLGATGREGICKNRMLG